MSKQSAAASGHSLWSKMPKASAELFALTYGSLVTELIRDYEDVAEVNSQLDRIGHSIGIRCVDEFLAKAEVGGVHVPRCEGLRETADVVARIGFRMFLGVNAEVGNFSPDGSGFSLFLHDNPLSIFVELPSAEEGGPTGQGGGMRSVQGEIFQHLLRRYPGSPRTGKPEGGLQFRPGHTEGGRCQ